MPILKTESKAYSFNIQQIFIASWLMAKYLGQSNEHKRPHTCLQELMVGETDGKKVNDKIMPGGK